MDLHPSFRPRERLQRLGPAALKNDELLAILLGTGTAGKSVMQLSRDLLRGYSDKSMADASYPELRSRKGIGPAKACVILAAFELTRRLTGNDPAPAVSIQSPRDALVHLYDIRARKKEHFVVLYLNARNQLLHKDCVSVGTLNSSLVHPREVFAPAIEHSAAGVILAHNHPSGDCQPSREDLELTKRIASAGELLGIEVLDHLVVSASGHCSLKEKALL